jgi:hypothetical protein
LVVYIICVNDAWSNKYEIYQRFSLIKLQDIKTLFQVDSVLFASDRAEITSYMLGGGGGGADV